MGVRALFAGLVLAAALAPVLMQAAHQPRQGPVEEDVAWPMSLQGRSLTQLPLSAVEQRFAARFPGQIGRFTDGTRTIIVRAVWVPTRMLHPAADCFRGLGYSLQEPRVVKDAAGFTWSCFTAVRNGMRRRVCERIYDLQGQTWTDVSSWYWSAVLGRTERPWYAITVVSAQ